MDSVCLHGSYAWLWFVCADGPSTVPTSLSSALCVIKPRLSGDNALSIRASIEQINLCGYTACPHVGGGHELS